MISAPYRSITPATVAIPASSPVSRDAAHSTLHARAACSGTPRKSSRQDGRGGSLGRAREAGRRRLALQGGPAELGPAVGLAQADGAQERLERGVVRQPIEPRQLRAARRGVVVH